MNNHELRRSKSLTNDQQNFWRVISRSNKAGIRLPTSAATMFGHALINWPAFVALGTAGIQIQVFAAPNGDTATGAQALY